MESIKKWISSKINNTARQKGVSPSSRMVDDRIDLVSNGAFKNFMYMDDLAYTNIPAPQRNQGDLSSSQALQDRACIKQLDLDKYLRTWYPSEGDFEHRLLAHFLKHLPDFMAVDVGCQYGTSAMSTARFIQSFGKGNPILAFDPGKAGQLAHFNIVNNGFEEMIRFFPYAVSDFNGFVLLFQEPGHSENNRIVNRVDRKKDIAKPVRSVRLEDFLKAEGHSGPVFIKIDTQGAEYEVFKGLGALMTEGMTAGITEYTPWALASRIDPLTFLEKLVSTHLVLNLGCDHRPDIDPLLSIEAIGLSNFSKAIDDSPSRWTDLLFIPRNLPGLAELLGSYGVES
jgi:FkbM family methyltransferase